MGLWIRLPDACPVATSRGETVSEKKRMPRGASSRRSISGPPRRLRAPAGGKSSSVEDMTRVQYLGHGSTGQSSARWALARAALRVGERVDRRKGVAAQPALAPRVAA